MRRGAGSTCREGRGCSRVIEGSFRRMADGEVEIAPRRRLRLRDGGLADMAAVDLGLDLAGAKVYSAFPEGAAFVVCLFDATTPELLAVIEADQLGRLRTGAASGVAARHLARPGVRTLGVIGCGSQAETQVACVRAGIPSIERVVAYCRTPERLAEFCERTGAEPAESHRDAAGQDVVVTITTSKDPVLRGEWLDPGTLVIAAGANHPSRREELDNVVLERAAFVCCDWLEQARIESGDLIEPVAAGVLDWLEVHELHEVVAGEVQGRQSDGDIVVFKSNGLAAWDVALGGEALRRARERGVGTALSGGSAAGRHRGLRGLKHVARDRLHDLGSIEQTLLLLRRQPVLNILVRQDLIERPPSVVLPLHDVARDVLLGGASLEEEREEVLEPRHQTRLYPGDEAQLA